MLIPYCDPCLFHRTRTAWLVLAALDRQDLGARGNFYHFIFDVIFTYHHFHRSPFPSFTFPSLTIHFAPSIAQPSVTKAPQPHEIQSLGTNLRCGAKFETWSKSEFLQQQIHSKDILQWSQNPFAKEITNWIDLLDHHLSSCSSSCYHWQHCWRCHHNEETKMLHFAGQQARTSPPNFRPGITRYTGPTIYLRYQIFWRIMQCQ